MPKSHINYITRQIEGILSHLPKAKKYNGVRNHFNKIKKDYYSNNDLDYLAELCDGLVRIIAKETALPKNDIPEAEFNKAFDALKKATNNLEGEIDSPTQSFGGVVHARDLPNSKGNGSSPSSVSSGDAAHGGFYPGDEDPSAQEELMMRKPNVGYWNRLTPTQQNQLHPINQQIITILPTLIPR